MDFLGSPAKALQQPSDGEGALYRALTADDLPAAWLLTRPLLERAKADKLPCATAFNCGLCLYRLNEYEQALTQLKRAEQALGNPPDVDAGEKKLFLRALAAASPSTPPPMDPDGGGAGRCALIRVRQLMALCLIRLERRQEAAPMIRFLSQYQIEL